MIDRQKVLKGLECCVHSEDTGECHDECPYYDKCWVDEDLYVSLHKDALELLKDEPLRVLNIVKYNFYHGDCPHCGKRIHYNSTKYCPHCGRAVKWK